MYIRQRHTHGLRNETTRTLMAHSSSIQAHGFKTYTPMQKTYKDHSRQPKQTLIYVFTTSKGKKTTHNSPGLTNCHGDSYTHDQTSSRRCKGLGHASTARGQTLNSRLANRIAFWATRNEVGRTKGWFAVSGSIFTGLPLGFSASLSSFSPLFYRFAGPFFLLAK